MITLLNLAYFYLVPIVVSYLSTKKIAEDQTNGIIGGSDGPTSILVAGFHTDVKIIYLFACLSVIGVGYLIITSKKLRQSSQS